VLALRCRGLSRRYGSREALAPLDLELEEGLRLGLVGPNGSGKSTLLQVLSTLLPPSAGEVERLGLPPEAGPAIRAQLGVVFQSPSLDLRFSALENLEFYAALALPWGREERLRRCREGLVAQGLADRLEEPVELLSPGLRRRVELARALLGQPRLLLLDEPSTGLDPLARAQLWEGLGAAQARGPLTIVLATHDLEEARRCDRLLVLVEGRVRAAGSPAELVGPSGDLQGALLRLMG
jgi:ABC-type multidrug transport system ATPase subunit